MIIGNPAQFAVEYSITEAYEILSQRALGYFVIHVFGTTYGIKTLNAALLGSAFYELKEIIERRGTHVAPFSSEPDATDIANGYLAAYNLDREHEIFFGMRAYDLYSFLCSKKIASGCFDEAFDDGTHFLLFDIEDQVRFIIFKNNEYVADPISDVWLDADEFYGILADYLVKFEGERAKLLEK
jgi:hypothetical protein